MSRFVCKQHVDYLPVISVRLLCLVIASVKVVLELQMTLVSERNLDHAGVVHDGHPSGRLPGDKDVGGGRDVVVGDEAPDDGRDDALAPELVRPGLWGVRCNSRQTTGSVMVTVPLMAADASCLAQSWIR